MITFCTDLTGADGRHHGHLLVLLLGVEFESLRNSFETVSEVQLSDQISAQKGVRELARHAFCSEWPGFTVVV